MFAPVVTQAAKAIDKLDLSMKATGTAGSAGMGLLRKLSSLVGGGNGKQGSEEAGENVISRTGSRPVAMILPRHGPVIRQSVTQLLREYDGCAPPAACPTCRRDHHRVCAICDSVCARLLLQACP